MNRLPLLLAAALGPPSGGALAAPDLQAIETHLEEGVRAVQRAQYDEAIKRCEQGIQMLGNAYVRPDTIDDSGTRLTLAGIKAREGDKQTSAVLYCRVLDGRVAAYKSKTSR